jgi:WD40 repeat protein
LAGIPERLSGDQSEREKRLCELIASYLEAIENGATPDRASLLALEPELANELGEFFANEDQLGRLVVPLRRQKNDSARELSYAAASDDTGFVPEILSYPGSAERKNEPDPGDVPENSSLPGLQRPVQYFGDYELLSVIAQGGMGIVYRARQVSLSRIVALKMVRAGRHAAPDDLVRFRLEAEAAAHLDHPNIVPIYEVGEHEGHHYFSMKLIDGGNLAVLAGRFRSNPRAAARLMATVAHAVHFAHLRGILHRDLKPANILLAGRPDDPPDRLIPLVTDFGLAKRVEAADAAGLTTSGAIIGTPSYMAPEQAEGRREAVTTAADIHALGGILNELLVGKPPFRGDSVMETLRLVREVEPTRPRSIDPRIPRDLETIILKSLEKRPAARYHSAEAMADDLERWLAGKPIRARSASPPERLVKWVRRRPAAAALVILGVVSFLAVWAAVRGFLSAYRLETSVERAGMALDTEKRKRIEAQTELVNMEGEAYFKQLVAATDAWEQNEPVLADALLDRCPPQLRRWEWHHLRRRFHSELQTLRGHDGFLCAVSFRPDGTQVACAAESTGFALWETVSGQVSRRIPTQNGSSFGLAFDVAGTKMASAEASGEIRIWDLTTGQVRSALRGHQGWAAGVAFSADGATLASCGQDGTVRLWSLQATSTDNHLPPARILRGHTGPVFGVGFSPDGRTLASAGKDGTVRLWSLSRSSGDTCRVLRGHQQAVRCVTFHPDGSLVASAGADRTVRIWDLATGTERIRFGDFGNRVDGISFSPNGAWIATACLDRLVRVWDARSGKPVRSFPGHAAPAFSVTFSPDGTRLASASQDAAVKIWDLTSEPGVRLLSPEPRDVHLLPSPSSFSWVGGLSFRPDGSAFSAAGADQNLAEWNLSNGKVRLEHLSGRGALTAVVYSPDGRSLAIASGDRKVRIRNATSFIDTAVLEDHPSGLLSVAFAPDSSILATGGGDPLEIVQVPSGKVSPADGQPRPIRLWNVSTGSPLRSLNDHVGSIHALLFAPTGNRLISAGADRQVRIWDPSSGQLLQKHPGHTGAVFALTLAPDGRHFASAGAEGSIRVWDLAENHPPLSLTGHTNWVLGLAFHPDGSRIASAGADGTVRLWDTSGGREILALRGHHDRVFGVAFSPDGSRLASASADGVVRIWETDFQSAADLAR